MSKLLANQISNYNDNGPVEAKEGINVPTGKPFQVAGGAGTSGQFLKSTGSSVAWQDFPTIPAAQVNADWNATSGLAQISNKPTLHTVATSGQYSDLSGLPSIPAAQVNSDWNSSSGVSQILNKPTLFSGSYTDLTNKPTIPSNLADLANVSSNSPSTNDVLSWDGSTWSPSSTSGGGSASFIGLTDTPSNFTSQAGKWLKVNASANALEYVNAPYDTSYTQAAIVDGSNVKLRLSSSQAVNDDILITAGSNITISDVTANGFKISSNPDTNTTYTQGSVASGNNINLRLSGSNGQDDDILLTAGNGINFSSVTSGGFTITSSGATVTTDDTAPGTPQDGDLWWKSDEGRLKVYYSDADSDQWVDASPPAEPPATVVALSDTPASYFGATGKYLRVNSAGNAVEFVDSIQGAMTGHLIPDSNAAYDLGNAEYKIRHLFLSDNTVYFQGDFLKVAQHNSGGSAQSASYLIPLAKLKDALNASSDYEAFKTAILAITDA